MEKLKVTHDRLAWTMPASLKEALQSGSTESLVELTKICARLTSRSSSLGAWGSAAYWLRWAAVTDRAINRILKIRQRDKALKITPRCCGTRMTMGSEHDGSFINPVLSCDVCGLVHFMTIGMIWREAEQNWSFHS